MEEGKEGQRGTTCREQSAVPGRRSKRFPFPLMIQIWKQTINRSQVTDEGFPGVKTWCSSAKIDFKL